MLGRLAFRRVAPAPELAGGDGQERAGPRIELAEGPRRNDALLERRGGVFEHRRYGAHAPEIPEGAPLAQGARRLLHPTIPTGRVEGRPT